MAQKDKVSLYSLPQPEYVVSLSLVTNIQFGIWNYLLLCFPAFMRNYLTQYTTDVGDHNGAEGRPSVLSMLHESEESSFRIPSNTRPDIPREGQHGDHHGVVCCNPEKLRDKLWCKGGGSIKSIEIKLPPAKRASPPREPTGKQESPPPTAGLLAGYCCTECYHGQRGGPCYFGVPPPPPCFWTYGRPVYDRWVAAATNTIRIDPIK